MSGKSKAKKRSDEAFPGQHPNEEVLLVFNQHPLVMRKPLIYGLLAILLGTLPLAFPQIYLYPWLPGLLLKILLAILAVVFAVWFYAWIGWYYSVYIVTSERIVEIKQSGLFSRQVSEWQLEWVQNVNYNISGLQAVLFGYGDLTAQTITGDLVMPKIHKPTEIHEQLLRIVRTASHGAPSKAAP